MNRRELLAGAIAAAVAPALPSLPVPPAAEPLFLDLDLVIAPRSVQAFTESVIRQMARSMSLTYADLTAHYEATHVAARVHACLIATVRGDGMAFPILPISHGEAL